MKDIYLFGMILVSNSFLLQGKYPEADTGAEIKEKFRLPGGETGTAAVVLNSLGLNVKMDGTFLGKETSPLIKKFFSNSKTDISSLYTDDNWDGLEDYMIIDNETRTPFGMFGQFYSSKVHRWNSPSEKDICESKTAAIDGFFGEQSDLAAQYCVKHDIPYVTIDCKPDTYLHQNAAVTVISGEFIGYSGLSNLTREELLNKYMESGSGLTIITNGSKKFIYGRKTTGIKEATPFKVNAVSTLGAGDTFKAGCTYALFKGMSDDDTVRFASACSAIVCTRFPIAYNPPKLEEVLSLSKNSIDK